MRIGFTHHRGHRGRGRMVAGLQLPVQSVPITTKAVSSNHFHGDVYSTTLCQRRSGRDADRFWHVAGYNLWFGLVWFMVF
jgi:hypothetical protein